MILFVKNIFPRLDYTLFSSLSATVYAWTLNPPEISKKISKNFLSTLYSLQQIKNPGETLYNIGYW